MSTSTAPATATWHPVCPIADIVPNTGVTALIGKRQVAVVRVVNRSGQEKLYGISNWCPFAKAMVLGRGLVGTKGDIPKLVSPVYKQSFDLRSGLCLDDAAVRVPVYETQVVHGVVQILL